jgi:hypothetical protein
MRRTIFSHSEFRNGFKCNVLLIVSPMAKMVPNIVKRLARRTGAERRESADRTPAVATGGVGHFDQKLF